MLEKCLLTVKGNVNENERVAVWFFSKEVLAQETKDIMREMKYDDAKDYCNHVLKGKMIPAE